MNNQDNKTDIRLARVDGYSMYIMSNAGQVYRITDSGELRKVGTVQANGYIKATLTDDNGRQRSEWVHRLIWQAFNGAIPHGMEVCHINDDKTDNTLANLLVATHRYNCNMGARNAKIADGVRRAWDKKRKGGK